jgi:S-adenosylmethionine-diacylgycerolhomoserine-N-methlytransferase
MPVDAGAESDHFDTPSLAAFYRWNAAIYDVTRPVILFGRREAVDLLRVERGDFVLDVGCGTGSNIPTLLERSARVVGVDSSPAMIERAQRRAERSRANVPVQFESAPYGSHSRHEGQADGVLFSYSLSMIPPFDSVVERAKCDLRSGGRIAVVDFLDAPLWPVRRWLTACHVHLGSERLRALESAFPGSTTTLRRTPLWTYFLFSATRG